MPEPAPGAGAQAAAPPGAARPPLSRRTLVTVVGLYTAASLPWMWYSEYVVEELIADPFVSKLVGTTNEWLFVLATAALLYGLLDRMAQRHREAADREAQALRREWRTAAQLQALAVSTPDAIFAKDLDGRYLLFNPAAEAVTGRRADEALGRTDDELVPAAAAAAWRSHDLEVMRSGEPRTFEEEADTPGGRRIFMSTKGPLRDEAGRVTGLFGIARDVTERIRLEREREAMHRMLADVLGRVTDAFVALDNQQCFVYANAQAARLWGRPSAEGLLGQPLWQVAPDADGVLREGYARALAGGALVSVETGDGGGRWLEYRIHPSSQGVSLYFLDITPRREAEAVLRQREEALRHSELRYRLAAAGGQVWDWDLATGEVGTTPAFWQRLGIEAPLRRRAGALIATLMHPQDRGPWRVALGQHLSRREPCMVEFRARHADGGWRWFRLQGQAVWNESGRATYMAGTTFDITEQRLAQEALLASQLELSELSQRLLDQERRTTRHLAQSLHDRLGQILGSARLHLDLAQDLAATASAAEAARPLQQASARVDDAIGEVRRTLVELRPPLLESQGLAASLDNELQGSGAVALGMRARLHADPAVAAQRWPEAVEYAAFMIAREAIANALRHAGARRLELHLSGSAARLELRVLDDGSGIPDGSLQGRPGHLGLVGMRERAIAIGAQLSVLRAASGGTEVVLAWTEAA